MSDRAAPLTFAYTMVANLRTGDLVLFPVDSGATDSAGRPAEGYVLRAVTNVEHGYQRDTIHLDDIAHVLPSTRYLLAARPEVTR